MRVEVEVCIALVADLLIGDPRWLPHPVRWIGNFALRIEAPLRRIIRAPRLAGIMAALCVLLVTGGCAYGAITLAGLVALWLRDLVSILILYYCFAARDLAHHASDVYEALIADDLAEARSRVARIVGRDTDSLDEHGVVRAAVESVAENTVDGVTAPLFFALLLGPIGAIVYKAISTLDSTFGYKNERYLHFGWASARIDDCAAWLPARLTLPVMTIAASLSRLSPSGAWRIGLRDARKHASPNSGFSEAAAAGALRVQLGGPLLRHGRPVMAPLLGDDLVPLRREHIVEVIRLMLVTEIIFVAMLALLRIMLVN